MDNFHLYSTPDQILIAACLVGLVCLGSLLVYLFIKLKPWQ